MNEKLECPYCHTMHEEPEECDRPNTHFYHECSGCGKTFGFTVDYTKNFYEYSLPCANGEPHDYKPIHGFPAEYFANKRRCSYCGKETTVEPIESISEAQKEKQ